MIYPSMKFSFRTHGQFRPRAHQVLAILQCPIVVLLLTGEKQLVLFLSVRQLFVLPIALHGPFYMP
jgi:hypothetical protein